MSHIIWRHHNRFKQNIFSYLIIYILFSVKEATEATEEVSLELPEEKLDYEESEDRPEDINNSEANKTEATEDNQKKDEITAEDTPEVRSEDSKTDKKSTDEKSRKESSDLSKSKSARVSIGKFTKGMVFEF